MTKNSIIRLVDAINREGLDNSHWSIVSDVETSSYFGTSRNVVLTGSWLVIYYDYKDTFYSFIDDCGVPPTYQMFIPEYDEYISLFRL